MTVPKKPAKIPLMLAKPPRRATSRQAGSALFDVAVADGEKSAKFVANRSRGKTLHPQKSVTSGVDGLIEQINLATPIEIVQIEKSGVEVVLINELSEMMQVPTRRMYDILGVANGQEARKVPRNGRLSGCGGYAALGLIKLLGITRDIVGNSTHPEAHDFDTGKWLGQWIERDQLSLGGRKPADLIATPTGVKIVAKLLGSISSGSYQ
jgi:uncharacterized protein (DUF2384 family)